MTASYDAILAIIVTSPDPVAAFRAYVEQEIEAAKGEAVAEIARLRAGGCARDQGLTQFCAEAAHLASELRKWQTPRGDDALDAVRGQWARGRSMASAQAYINGLTHANAHLTARNAELESLITDQQRAFVEATAFAENRHAADTARLRDLVRHQRGPLYDAELITDAEYAALAGDHGAVGRLEGYDAVRARLTAVSALLDDVMGVLRWSTERDHIRDPYYESLVEGLCRGTGYGALMDSAQRCWRRSADRRGDPPGGEHVAGPCRGTVDAWLRTYEALPGAKPPRGNGAHGVFVQIDTKESE